MTIRKLIKIITLMFFIISIFGCSQEIETRDENLSSQLKNKVENNKHKICAFPSPFIEIFERAWLDFSSKNGLEVATEKDFRFPEASLREQYTKLDIERWMRCPLLTGDFNNDDVEDFLVIAVNNKMESEETFSLIILNMQDNQKNIDKSLFLPKIVYQNKDLSNKYVSTSRAGLSVWAYQEDGSFTSCYIKWNGETQSYNCE